MNDMTDLLGTKPISEAINTSVTNIWELIREFATLPVKETSLLVRDKIRLYRIENVVKITEKMKKMLNKNNEDLNINNRMLYEIFEKGSLVDDENIQEKWAGLLASSFTRDGKDDSNLIFINLLSQLTSSEALVLDYVNKNAKTFLDKNGLIFAKNFDVDYETLQKISKMDDIHRFDRELDHLRTIGLIKRSSGFMTDEEKEKIGSGSEKILMSDKISNFHVTPTTLALNLYARCNGSQSPLEYFGLRKEI